MTLLEIIQDACREMAIPIPASVVGNPDPQVQQLLALAQRDGNELYRWKDDGWTALQTEFIINIEAPITTTGDVVLGSTTISNIPDTSGITANAYAVSGPGQPAAQRVVEVIDGTTVRVEMESTASEAGGALIFARDTYALPSDFDAYVSNTWWDRTNHWMTVGPQSPQFDQWQRSGIVTTGPRRRWRQVGRDPVVYRIWPPPTAQDTPSALVFEYVSNGWVKTQAGAYQNRYTADTDEFALNPQMTIQGVKWRFFQIKGFAYEAMQTEYADFVNREAARDGGAPDLNMGRQSFPYLITSANVQDGNFPGPT